MTNPTRCTATVNDGRCMLNDGHAADHYRGPLTEAVHAAANARAFRPRDTSPEALAIVRRQYRSGELIF